MSRRVAAVVLAGGLGTRLRSVLPEMPKQMAPVAGHPFIERVLRYLSTQVVRDVVISTGYRAEVFVSHFSSCSVPGLDSIECIAEPEPLGTAGGFLHAVKTTKLQPDAWLVLNGDSLVLADLSALLNCPAEAALLALWMEDAARYGSLELTDTDELLGFREKRPGSSWINAGVYLFAAGLLPGLSDLRPLSFETDVFPELLASQVRIRAIRVNAPFIDIGLPATLAKADNFILKNAEQFILRGELTSPEGSPR